MVKEKVTQGNDRVSQNMAEWNPFSFWPTYKTVFRSQLSPICFQSQVFMFLWKVIYNSVKLFENYCISPKLIHGNIFIN